MPHTERAELARLGLELNGFPSDGVDATEGGPVSLIPPPDELWARIAASTGVRVDVRSDEVRRTAETVAPEDLAPVLATPAPRPAPESVPGSAELRSIEPRASSPGRPGRPGRSDGLLTFVAAAALVIGLLAGAGAAVGLGRIGAPDASAPSASVLARAVLSALPDDPAAAGDVDVVQTGSVRQLQVSVRRLGEGGGFYEVWMANSTLSKMIPVGLLPGDTATFDLPADVDMAAYSTVDISLEPLDGDPAHSAHSVLRGTLSG